MEEVKTKVVIILLICAIVLLVIFSGTLCTGSKNAELDIELSKLTVADGAQKFYKFISPDIACEIVKSRVETIYCENVIITKCDPIYDLEENFFGYEVMFETEFYCDKVIVLDTNDFNLLIYQFTLYTLKNSSSVCINNLDSTNRERDSIIKKYIVSPFEIGECVDSKRVKIFNNIVSLESLKFNPNKFLPNTLSMSHTVEDVLPNDYKKDKDFSKWFGSGKSISVYQKFITNAENFRPTSQNSLNYETSNCGAAASFNVLKYYNDCRRYNIFKNKSEYEVYYKLISYMGAEFDTSIYQMAEGITKYINNETDKSASFTHYVPPMWNYFKGDLDNNNPVLYCIVASNGPHAMSAVGYLEVKENKKILPKKFKFLIVAGGYGTLSYTNFDAIDWKLGCVIKVK